MSLSSGTIACPPSLLSTGHDVRVVPYGNDGCKTIDELRPSKRLRLQDGSSAETCAGVIAAMSVELPPACLPAAVDVTVGAYDHAACEMSGGSASEGKAPIVSDPSPEPHSPAVTSSDSGGDGSSCEPTGFVVVEQQLGPASPAPAATTVPVRRADTYPRIREHPSPLALRSVSMPAEGGSSTSTALQQAVHLSRQPPEGQRGISLLLTFTDDSHKHLERVIRLGECLRKNGFTVTVDMPKQCFQTVAEAESFLRGRFEGSDYVLACVSPKYRTETESATAAGHSYHGKFVAELIVGGRRASIAAAAGSSGSSQQPQLLRPQLLCLQLTDTDESHVPSWLRSMRPLLYHWPRDFRDVLFCLSKPQCLFEMQAFPDLRHMLPDSSDMD